MNERQPTNKLTDTDPLTLASEAPKPHRPFTKAELLIASDAVRMVDIMLAADPDLNREEALVFAYHFILCKHALKVVQSDLFQEMISQTDKEEKA